MQNRSSEASSHSITLRTPAEIGAMRQAGEIVSAALETACSLATPGMTTGQIDAAVEALFRQAGAVPLFKNYPHPTGQAPFPAVTCISVNDEVVHGVPGDRVLVEGDVVAIDTGCNLDGWCGDSAVTVAVGQISPAAARLLEVTQGVLDLAIDLLAEHDHWKPIAGQMEAYVRDAGLTMIEDFVGHGIGRRMHEPPEVPNVSHSKWGLCDFPIQTGLVIAIEPMVSLGSKSVKQLADGWTVATQDGALTAHFEHTVAVTSDGPQRLTRWPAAVISASRPEEA